MPYEVCFDADKNLILVVVSGPLDKNYATEYTFKAAKLVKENKCQKFLFDLRDTVLTELAAGIVEYVSNLESIGFEKSYKAALVYTSDEENHKFTAFTAQTQGFNIHIFTDPHKAVNWLKED